jgi:acetate kinase
MYAIPYQLYETYGIRRYGFHGSSFRYVAKCAAEMVERSLAELKIVACHLGNGASVAAIEAGNSVDTSMGMTPLEGLMMGTRVGDIDPGAVMFLTSGAPNLPPARVYALLNEESGLLGVSGVSNDIRDVRRAAQHNRLCRLAIEMYAYRVTKYIGAYAAAMGGIDLVVFTGGIGENDYELRTLVCEGLGFMGIEIDERANRSTQGMQRDISSKDSRTRVLVVPSDEEVAIFRETIRVVATGASLGHGLGSKSKA